MKWICFFLWHKYELTHSGASDYLNGYDHVEHVCVRCNRKTMLTRC